MLIKQNSIGMALHIGLTEGALGYNPTPPLLLYVSKDGAAFVAAAGSAVVVGVAFLANAVIAVTLGAGDDDTLGELRWMVIDSISAPYVSTESHQVIAWNPNAVPDPWAVPLPGAYPAGQAGYLLGHSTSGDPWATVVPGGYPAGQAGYALGNMALATASVVLSSPNSIDVGLSLAQAMKLVTAVLCGVSSVSGFVVTFMDTTDSIARVVATLDGTGQRTGVVYNTA